MNEEELLDAIEYELVNWTSHHEGAAPALLQALRARGYDVYRPEDRRRERAASVRWNGDQIVWRLDLDAAECYRDMLAEYLRTHDDVGVEDDLKGLRSALNEAYASELGIGLI